jgi:hypothetical protein
MRGRSDEEALANQRWVRSQYRVANAVFAVLTGVFLLCCGGGVALWLLIARAADP